MPNKSVVLMPKSEEILKIMGEQIRLARLRRDLTVKIVAERAGVSTNTVWAIEKGNSSVSIGAYASVLHSLNGMDKDLLLVAKDDALGYMIQDLNLKTRKKASKRS